MCPTPGKIFEHFNLSFPQIQRSMQSFDTAAVYCSGCLENRKPFTENIVVNKKSSAAL